MDPVLESLETRVKAALGRALGVNESALVADARLYDDLGIDSLTFMETLSALEEELGVALPESIDFALELRTVDDVVAAFRDYAPPR